MILSGDIILILTTYNTYSLIDSHSTEKHLKLLVESDLGSETSKALSVYLEAINRLG